MDKFTKESKWAWDVNGKIYEITDNNEEMGRFWINVKDKHSQDGYTEHCIHYDGTEVIFEELGQLFYPYPVKVVDARCCENCSSEGKCADAKSCNDDVFIYCNECGCNHCGKDYRNWQPKED